MQVAQLYFYGAKRFTQVKYANGQVSTLFHGSGRLLAQRNDSESAFCFTDSQGSVLRFLWQSVGSSIAYSAYGLEACQNFEFLSRFTGQRKDQIIEGYHLGDGYRVYRPALMRFMSPDSLSPFGKGGINSYAYCSGDSVNKVDPSGHMGGYSGGSLGGLGLSEQFRKALTESLYRHFTARVAQLSAGKDRGSYVPTLPEALASMELDKKHIQLAQEGLKSSYLMGEQREALKALKVGLQQVVGVTRYTRRSENPDIVTHGPKVRLEFEGYLEQVRGVINNGFELALYPPRSSALHGRLPEVASSVVAGQLRR